MRSGSIYTPSRGLRLVTLVLYLTGSSFAASWVIMLKDGSRIECDNPFLVVNGAYTFLDRDGQPHTIPVEEVDAPKTEAANSGVSAASPDAAPLPVNLAAGSGPLAGDALVTFRPPYGTPPGPSWNALQIRPSEERFFVHVPRSYTGQEPFGMIVYIDSEDQTGLPAGWPAVFEEKKLLFVAAQGSGNSQNILRRLGLAALGALQMKKLYNIDPLRVYATGFSGGARIANELAFYNASVFNGAILNSGAEFYERVPRVRAASLVDTQGHPYGYGMVKLAPRRLATVRRRMRFAMITGSRDFRRGNILDIYYGGYVARGFHAQLFDVEGLGHETCGAPTLAQAIDYLDR